jgi:hypothetical protein
MRSLRSGRPTRILGKARTEDSITTVLAAVEGPGANFDAVFTPLMRFLAPG